MKRSVHLRPQLILLALLLGLLVAVQIKHQAIEDWIHLYGYSPPAQVSQLASQDTMTPAAMHLFYVNRPLITAGSAFTNHCPSGGEKTVVLGCYIGPDAGIYIYAVSDPRLNGVEQVTAAHEMLHAAYRRLSDSDRRKVDALLTDYYDHGLADKRIQDTIAAYKKSEPNDVVNEMYAVFGTEIANLPAPLEHYYQQYFSDRSTVTNYTAQYQAEFTNRQMQVQAYDTQLGLLKAQIGNNETQLSQQKDALSTQSNQLQAERANGQVAAYNSGVGTYNNAVNAYNTLLEATRNLISQYNSTVQARNSIALEEQQLVNALSPNSLPPAK